MNIEQCYKSFRSYLDWCRIFRYDPEDYVFPVYRSESWPEAEKAWTFGIEVQPSFPAYRPFIQADKKKHNMIWKAHDLFLKDYYVKWVPPKTEGLTLLEAAIFDKINPRIKFTNPSFAETIKYLDYELLFMRLMRIGDRDESCSYKTFSELSDDISVSEIWLRDHQALE